MNDRQPNGLWQMRSGAPILKQQRTKILLVIGLLIGSLLFFHSIALYQSTDVSKPAPEFGFRLKDGTPKRLSQYRGKLVLINFWASWCAPCMEEMVSFRHLEQRMHGRPSVLLLFNVYDNETMTAAERGRPNEYPLNLVYDYDRSALEHFQIQSIPQTVLLDPQGNIRRIYRGPRDWANEDALREMEAWLPGGTQHKGVGFDD